MALLSFPFVFEPALELGTLAWLWPAGFVVFAVLCGVTYFASLFLICMLCHGELARLQPHPRYLTEYFLMMSAGGALGGLFVSVIAPSIFDTFFEWKIGLWGSFVIAVLLSAAALEPLVSAGLGAKRLALGLGTLGILAAGSYFIAEWQKSDETPIYMNRNFYGRVAVYEYDQETPMHHRTFKSGRVAHGQQYLADDKRRMPIAYYGEETGAGRVLAALRDKPDARVGVIGMGAGTMAAFAEPGHYYRIYEINPEAIHIAQNYFSYLKDCKGECDIVLGDARLSLEREEPNHFDVLCLDAFSGDAVPAHLLTDEAFQIYEKHLKPDGVLVFHVTNSYLNLVPVVEGLAEKHGYQWTRFYIPRDSEKLRFRTDYMLVTKNEEFLKAHPSEVPAERVSTLKVPLWTDRYNNIFQILR